MDVAAADRGAQVRRQKKTERYDRTWKKVSH